MDRKKKLIAEAKEHLKNRPPAELRTLKHDKRYQPWKVTFSILQSSLDPGHAQEFYVRGGTMNSAATFAMKLWHKWFRLDNGITQESAYPAIASFENEAGAEVVVLDEETYMEAYDMVKKVPHRVAGEPINPDGFAVVSQEHLRSGDFVHVMDAKDG